MYLGIDLGTSSLKVKIIDKFKEIVWENQELFNFINLNNGWTEQDPKKWILALDKNLKKIPEKYRKKIEGLSITGQMHGSVFLDKNNKVIRNVILWNDQRTEKATKKLNKMFPNEIALSKIGNIFLTGFTAPKILWLKEHEFENFKKIEKILLPKDYLVYLMTGKYYSDYSDSIGTAYMNIKTRKWDKDIISYLGITEKQLPNLVKSTDFISKIKITFADKYGLPKDLQIFAGGGDNPIGAIGSSVIDEGTVSFSFGTSGVVYAPTKKLVVDKRGRMHSFISGTNNYYLMGVSLSTASSVNWFVKNVLKTREYKSLFGQNMYNRPITDLIFTPYLNGERTPYFDSNIRGSLLNINLDTDKLDIAKSILEGIIFSLKDSFQIIKENKIPINKIFIQGGLTKNAFFNQIVADILGETIYIPKSLDAPSYGAALIAYAGVNKLNIIDVINYKKSDKVYVANSALHNLYKEKYKKFKKAYIKTKN